MPKKGQKHLETGWILMSILPAILQTFKKTICLQNQELSLDNFTQEKRVNPDKIGDKTV